MRRLFVLGLLLLATEPAVEYGGLWSLRAHPVPDVTVRLRSGQSVTGELSRSWSKDWLLRTPGGVLQFPENGGYQWMTFQATREQGSLGSASTLISHWRSFLPLALLCIVAVACALDGFVRRPGRARALERQADHD